MSEEIIICAAVRWGDKVWYGHRHRQCFDAMYDELSYSMSRKQIMEQDGRHEEGFVTSRGRFVDRKEAYFIHTHTIGKSASRDGYRGAQLYSEDLY